MVQVGRRLVSEHQLGIGHQRPRYRHPLLLPAGKLIGPLVRLVLHADRIKQGQDALATRLGCPALHHEQGILDVFVGGKYRYQVEILKHETEVLAAELRRLAPAERGDVGIEDGQFAAGGMIQAADHIEKRRLAAAGRTDEGDEGGPLDGEIHPLDGLHRHLARLIGFDKMLGTNQAHWVSLSFRFNFLLFTLV